jgi:hypothetical protein
MSFTPAATDAQPDCIPQPVDIARPRVPVITTWSESRQHPDPEIAATSAYKDEMMSWYVHQLVQLHAAELVPLLEAANAWLIAVPGGLYVFLPDRTYFPLDTLGPYMTLLPWKEPSETAH